MQTKVSGSNGEAISIIEVIGDDPINLEKYLALYEEFFPYYDYYVPYMRDRGHQRADADPRFIEHWWLLEINGKPAAIREFKYVPGRNCGVALIIAIKPEYRRVTVEGYSSLAHFIVSSSLEQLKIDAASRDQALPIGMVSELQLPETAGSEDVKQFRKRLIAVWRRFGFQQLPVDYLEPPYVQGTEQYLDESILDSQEFLPLMLGIIPIPGGGFDAANREMIADLTRAMLVDNYGLSEDHWVVERALASISERLSDSKND